MTIYVLEGPDLAGKTTLADEICKTLTERGDIALKRKTNQPRRGATQLDLFGDYFRSVQWAVMTSGPHDHVVFDRLHVGEWVYGHHKRGNPLLTWSQIEALDNLLDNARDVRKIYVDVEYDVMMMRHRIRGDDYVNMSELASIADTYRATLYGATYPSGKKQPDLHGWQRVFMMNGDVPDVI